MEVAGVLVEVGDTLGFLSWTGEHRGDTGQAPAAMHLLRNKASMLHDEAVVRLDLGGGVVVWIAAAINPRLMRAVWLPSPQHLDAADRLSLCLVAQSSVVKWFFRAW